MKSVGRHCKYNYLDAYVIMQIDYYVNWLLVNITTKWSHSMNINNQLKRNAYVGQNDWK